MQKLGAIKVPWRILACYEIIDYKWIENGGLYVRFKGSFSPSTITQKIKHLSIQLCRDTTEEEENRCTESIFKITFPIVYYFSMEVNTSVVNNLLDKYDTSDFDFISGSKFFSKWNDTGICPNCRMYTVKNSTLLQNSHFPLDKPTHYIIAGHDILLNIVSSKFSWIEEK